MQETLLHTIMVPIQLIGEIWRKLSQCKIHDKTVGDSASKYILIVSGYSGTAGDSLTYHNGRSLAQEIKTMIQ